MARRITGIKGINRRFRLPWRTAANIRQDVDDELRFHLEMRERELVAAGMAPELAREEARRAFGDLEYTRAYCRDQDARGERAGRRAEWMGDLWHDARYALRALRRAPGFALVATLTLALGIGANAAIFSVVNRMLINPLPFADADRMIQVWRSDAKNSFLMGPMRDVAIAWQRRMPPSLEAVELYTSDELTLAGEPEAESVRAARISPTYTAFLGVRPITGRGFVVEDTAAGSPDVVLLGESLWRRRYGASSEVLGRTVRLAGKPYVVVGVMPRTLEHSLGMGNPPALFVPFRGVTDPPKQGEGHSASVLGRLKPGATVEQAQRELAAIAAPVDSARPNATASEFQVSVMRPGEVIGNAVRTALLVLLGAVGFVLLIACANVANLLLARATAREREIAVRAALGAGRGRLVRQMLAESLVLAVLGGAAGLLIAIWGLDAIVGLRPDSLRELDNVRLDPLVLGASALLSLVTGLLFGLAPALHATRPAVGESLKAGTRSATSAAAGRRFRSALVAAEVALSLVLLAGAGLLVRSVMGLQQTDPGFVTSGLLSVNFELPVPRYADAAAYRPFYQQLADGAARLPGVQRVTVANGVPPRVGISFGQLEVEGGGDAAAQAASAADGPMVSMNWVDPEYFRLLRIPMRAGRLFSPDEMAVGASSDVAVINADMARRYWPGQDPLGKRFRVGARGAWTTVVGVVGDVKVFGLMGDHGGNRQIYAPSSHATWPHRTLVLRVAGDDPTAVVPALKQLVRSIDPEVPLREIASVESMMAESIDRPRFNMTLLAAFAVLALVLAAVGLYGVIGYSVSQRTREIGVRMALGARPGNVLRLVVAEGMRPALLGVALGLALSLALGRALAGLLHGVSPRDPATLAGVSLLLIGVSLVACLIPARRAARVDPMEAIRAE